MNQPREFAESLDGLREILYGRAAQISELLRGEVEGARAALAKFVDRIVLTPRNTPEGPLLDIEGEVEILNGKRRWGGSVHQ